MTYTLDSQKQNGGIVMVNFNPPFINCTAENALNGDERTASLEQVAGAFVNVHASATKCYCVPYF